MTDINTRTTTQAPYRAKDDLGTFEFSGAPMLELIDQFRQFAREVYAPGSLRLIEAFHGNVNNMDNGDPRILVTVWTSPFQD